MGQVVAKVSIVGETHPEPLMESDFMARPAPGTSGRLRAM